MRIFLTGASGFIGSIILQDLLKAGHQVIGLARSDKSAEALKAQGVQVQRGDIEDLESLRKGAVESDGVIHTAFNHDFSKFAENCENDRKAIEAMGSAIKGSSRPIVITSGTALVSPGKLALESASFSKEGHVHPRTASEVETQALVDMGLNASLVRLAPTVHDVGDHGFVPMLINIARQKGVSAYVGEGANRWNAVHRKDAAKLYQLAFEKGAKGARYHGTAEEGIPFKDIAAAIGKGLGLPVVSLKGDEANAHFGWFNSFASLDCPASNQITRESLNWNPTHATLFEDLRPDGSYFKT